VPVGTVTGLLIQIDQRDKTFQVPVQFEIDLKRLTTQLGTYVDLANPNVLRQQIADGLRAQLQMVSIVTGQLYVELNYRSDAAPPDLESRATAWPEIPTTPSLMSALGTGAGSLVADMMKVLFQVNEMLADVNMPEINKAVVASAQAVERLVSAPEIRSALQQIPGMTAQINQTMAEVQQLAARSTAAIDPLQVQLTSASTEAVATLKELRRTMEETHGLLSADTGPGFALQGALISLRDAADALRLLITSLEQNPDMMLRGKRPPGK
jgi:paraquat-inducible protein B